MRRLPAIQKCDFPAVFLRVFFGWGGRGEVLFLFLVFCVSSFGQEVSISSSAINPTQQNPVPITFEFDEPIDGFALEDVIIDRGALSDFHIETPDYSHTGFSKRLSTFELDALNPDISKASKAIIAFDIDAQGTVYALTFNDGIYFFNSSGNAVSGNPQYSKEKFSDPRDIAVGPNGTIYVADAGNNRIVAIAPNQSISYLGENILKAPTGLAIDSEGNVYVADTENNRVVVFDLSTQTHKIVNGSGGQSLSNPIRLAVDQEGYIYVNDLGNDRIQIFTPEGNYSRTISSGNETFLSAGSIVVDDYGFVYIADFNSTSLEVFLNYEDVDPLELAPILLGEQLSIKVFNPADLSVAAFSITESVDIPVDIALKPCGYLAVNNGDAVLGEYKVVSVYPFRAEWPVTFLFDLRLYNRLPDTFSANLTIDEECEAATVSVPAGVGENKDCEPIPQNASNVFTMVWDETNPLIDCPAENVTISADSDELYRIPDLKDLVTDNCNAKIEISQNPSPNTTVTAPGTITLTATDAAGNSTTCTIGYDLEEEPQTPAFTCLPSYTLYLDDNGEATLEAEQLIEGDAEGVNFTLNKENFDCSDIGSEKVILNYSGAVTGTCEIEITVEDKGRPTAVCIGNYNLRLKPGETITLTGDELDAGSFDSCAEFDLNFTLSKYTFTDTDEGSNPVVFTATDLNGNEDTCTVNVQVIVEEDEDTEDPVFTFCPEDESVPTDTGVCGAYVEYEFPTATDNSGNPTVTKLRGPDSGDFLPPGEYEVIFEAEDAAGNTATCTIEIFIRDEEAPVVESCRVEAIIEVESGFTIPNYFDIYEFIASDNCEGNLTFRQTPPSTTVITEDTTINIVAIDEAGNESEACTFQLIIKPEDQPSFNCGIPPATLDLDVNCDYPERDFRYLITERQNFTDGIYIEEIEERDGNTLKVTLEVYHGEDETGDFIGVCKFEFSLLDKLDPVIDSCNNSPVNLELMPGENFTVPNYSNRITYTENCGEVSIIQFPEEGTIITQNTTVSITVEDDAGNSSSVCSFAINFQDLPDSIQCRSTEVALGTDGTAVLDPAAVYENNANDLPIQRMEVEPNNFSCTDLGVQPVELTVFFTDGSSARCSTHVEVVDQIPVVTNCPVEVVDNFDPEEGYVIPNYREVFNSSDNCDFEVTQVPPPGTVVYSSRQIDFIAEDQGGNTVVCYFLLQLNPVEDLEITSCPENKLVNVDSNCGVALSDYTSEVNTNKSAELVQDPPPGSMIFEETLVAITATGENGETAECIFTVFPEDNQHPSFTCPEEQSLTLEGGEAFVIPDYEEEINASDNCRFTVTQTPAPGTSITESTGVEIHVIDDAGNDTWCSFVIFIVDEENPLQIVCPGEQAAEYGDHCSYELPDYTLEAETTLSGAVITQSPPAGTVVTEDTTIVLTATSGTETASCYFDLELQDNTPPVAVCMEEFTLYLNDEGYGILSADIIDDGSYDNCGTVLKTLSQTRFETSDVGEHTVTLTVTDASGHTDFCETKITVVPPDESGGVGCPENLTLSLDENGEYDLSLTYTGDEDNLEVELSKEHFTCEDIGTETITVTYLGEHTGSCEIEVTIVDDLPPVVSCISEFDLRLNASGVADLSINDLVNDYNDNCGISNVSLSQENFTTADLGLNEVVFTAIDDYGNQSTCQISVNVLPYEDGETDPFECVDLHVLELGENGRATLNPRDLFTGGSGSVQYTVSKDLFTCNDLGENTVVLNYTTPTEEGTCEVTVVVEDPHGSCQDPTDPETREYIILYPNPGDGNVRFQTSPGLEIHRVEVFDMRGRFLFEKSYDTKTIFDNRLDLREFQSGVYAILIFTNSREFLKRAIIRN